MDDTLANTKTDYLVTKYINRYNQTKRPIPVNFKKTLNHLNYSERYTHLIHSYPAKLLIHIPYFFLNNEIFSNEGDYVLDPFCGTGTVLLETMLAKRRGLGADANPLARLITEVKTTKYEKEELTKTLKLILQRSKNYKQAQNPDVVNIDHWFPKKTQNDLAKILRAINTIKKNKIRSFFLICFSNCIKKVSFADPRIAVPVKINPEKFKKDNKKFAELTNHVNKIKRLNVFLKFKDISLQNIERSDTFNYNCGEIYKAKVISEDARNLTKTLKSTEKIGAGTIQLVITSPPYAGAQKYIRSSSLNLGWIGLADTTKLKELDNKNIGRENYKAKELTIKATGIKKADALINKVHEIDPVRAKIIAQYLIEMKTAINESIRVLKKNGYFVLIVGNNKVCGMEFNTQSYLTEYIESKGLNPVFKLIDDIKSYGLMTKRNKTADIISREWVLVFKK